MKLEDQVSSLELAKRLKKIGVKQDGFWTWAIDLKRTFGVSTSDELDNAVLGEKCRCYRSPFEADEYKGGGTNTPEYELVHCDGRVVDGFSAFAVAELGEILPNTSLRLIKRIPSDECPWAVQLGTPTGIVDHYATEADARARLLVCLIERGELIPSISTEATPYPLNDEHQNNYQTDPLQ